MKAVIKRGVFDIDGVKVKANFQILGRALETGVSTAVSISIDQSNYFLVYGYDLSMIIFFFS